MNELKVFNNNEFGNIRTINVDNQVWFVGKDVAKCLGYENTKKAVKLHVDNEDKIWGCKMDTPSNSDKIIGSQNTTPSNEDVFYLIDNVGRKQYPIFINESGLYSLILSSKLPKAKKFKHWVTSEVLPTIRKTGSYGSSNIDVKLIAEIATISATQVATIMMKEFSKNTKYNEDVIQNEDISLKNSILFPDNSQKLKVECFPEEFKDELDDIFVQMKENENINFSAISRYCYKKGYPISNVSLARYFKKNFDY